MNTLNKLNVLITNFFTLWIILFSLIAYSYPNNFIGLKSLIVPTLGIIMFGMGMTLTIEDFKRVFLRPVEILIGTASQFLVMPLAGFTLAKAFSLEQALAVGIILVGSCPGGTASNVITYLAKGDLALSVTLTSVSTILSPIFIPLLMFTYANQWIEVPVAKLFISSFQIVIIPITLGLFCRNIFGRWISKIISIMPSISSAGIIFIVGVIVAANSSQISKVGSVVLLLVIIHNLFGLIFGYSIAKFFGMTDKKAKAISFEVGMQNSGLGVALATNHFSPLTALPAAVFSVWHNLSGSALAWWWRRD